jgi:hypothetical protein
MTAGWAQISDEAADYLRGLVDAHVPGKGGWCRCCARAGCRTADEARIELAISGRLEITPPWLVRPEPGRWP